MVEITRATREKSKLRIALAGVSGGGKTLGALLLASGLTGGDFSKVCLIDTDTAVNKDKSYYAKSGVDYVKMEPAEGDNPKTKGWFEITPA